MSKRVQTAGQPAHLYARLRFEFASREQSLITSRGTSRPGTRSNTAEG